MMRRIAAFILGIVYMAFTFSAMGYSHGNAVHQHAISVGDGCDNESEASCTAHYEKTAHFKKAPKHHAPSGKVKVPRPGNIHITIADRQVNETIISASYPNAIDIGKINSNNLYLKNRVLLI
jgi:hypothetical protein